MATRRTHRKSRRAAAAASPSPLLDTLHQVYLAGLGAAARARSGGPQLFDELVAEGARVHADTRGAAEKALQGIRSDFKAQLGARVGQVRGQATEALDGLEKIFRTRVHRALAQLGVPRAEEVLALSKRVDALNANVEKLTRRPRRGGTHSRSRAGHRPQPPAAAT